MYSWVEDEKCSSFPHKALSRLICRWGTRRVQSRPHQGGGAALGPPMGPCVPVTHIEERRSKGGRGDPAGGRWLRRRRQQQRLALGAAVAGGSGGARRRDNGATERLTRTTLLFFATVRKSPIAITTLSFINSKTILVFSSLLKIFTLFFFILPLKF